MVPTPRRWIGPAALLVALGALAGCAEDPLDGPQIDRVRPSPIQPGGRLTIEGVGFGERGSVAIGGRPLPLSNRTPTLIDALAPADLPGGRTLLVVYADGRPSAGFPVEVAGSPGETPPPRAFPEGLGSEDADGGSAPVGDGGAGPGPIGPDLGPGGEGWVARFTADPSRGRVVTLEQADSPPGLLDLRVRVREGVAVRGLALHLAYDPTLLSFSDAQPAASRGFVVAEIGPGRLALGRRFAGDPAGEAVTRLRFRLNGPGEGRIDLPARHRTARNAGNRPIAGFTFAGGSVLIEAAR